MVMSTLVNRSCGRIKVILISMKKLNPAQMKREISRLQAELIESVEKKGQQVRERTKKSSKGV
jgi:hypothetical protein